jgi:tyrosyl-tRNA synthetase
MTLLKSEFLQTLQERGFLYQATHLEELDAKAAKQAITAYVGFDATADSFHVGNLVQINLMRWLQKTGHNAILLLGGGTTKIGDPSGKDEMRKLRTDDEIDANIERLKSTFTRFVEFGGVKNPASLVNNAEWLDELKYIPFLRDVGKHFSVNRMLTFDTIKSRLEREQPLSFIEFNYMVLQAYDFAELNRRYDCSLQTGGADQWGNIVSGVELGRRLVKGDLYGLTTPLITTASGTKMGKTASGAIWLNADKRSAYEYYQFWRNTEDADVGRFLKLFTDMPLDEIAKLEALQGQEINEAKKILALEATTLCHGRAQAEAAAETARAAFEEGALAEGLPTIDAPATIIGSSIADLVVLAGLAASKGEARRLIKQGGITIGSERPTDEHALVDQRHAADGTILVSAGKKRRVLVKLM